MSITLTSAMTPALGATISQPGLFLQMGFSTPLYFTDRGARSWNGQTWTAGDFIVSSYALDMSVVQKITLSFADSDYSLAALLLNQTSADKNVKLWYFDSTATATVDPVLIFDGLIDDASGGDSRRLNIPCSMVNKQLPVGMLAHLIPSYLFIPEDTTLSWGPDFGSITFNRRVKYL